MNRRFFLKSVAGAGVATALPLPVAPVVTTLTTYVPKIGETIQVRMPMRYNINPGDRFVIAGIERTFVVASTMKHGKVLAKL